MNKEKQISVDTFIEIYNFFIEKDKNYNEEKKEEILSEIASTLEDIEYVIGDIKEKLKYNKIDKTNLDINNELGCIPLF